MRRERVCEENLRKTSALHLAVAGKREPSQLMMAIWKRRRAMKRRICSYDMAAVPDDSYVVVDDGGEVYLCNGRCLCIWAVLLATKPGLEERSVAAMMSFWSGGAR